MRDSDKASRQFPFKTSAGIESSRPAIGAEVNFNVSRTRRFHFESQLKTIVARRQRDVRPIQNSMPLCRHFIDAEDITLATAKLRLQPGIRPQDNNWLKRCGCPGVSPVAHCASPPLLGISCQPAPPACEASRALTWLYRVGAVETHADVSPLCPPQNKGPSRFQLSPCLIGGARRDRTVDLYNAIVALSS